MLSGETLNGHLPSLRLPPTAGFTDHTARLSIGSGGGESIHPVADAFRTGCGVDRLEGAGARHRRSLRVREQTSHHSLDFVLVRLSGGVEPHGAAGGQISGWGAAALTGESATRTKR